jgi:hypothetical protein
VRFLSPSEIADIDPHLDSFRNLNTPAQWHQVLAQAAAQIEPLAAP